MIFEGSIEVVGGENYDHIEVVTGNISSYLKDITVDFPNLKEVYGGLHLQQAKEFRADKLETVGLNMSLRNSHSISLKSLTSIKTSCSIQDVDKAYLPSLKTIGEWLFVIGSARLSSLESIASWLRIEKSRCFLAPLLKDIPDKMSLYDTTWYDFSSLESVPKGFQIGDEFPGNFYLGANLQEILEAPLTELPVLMNKFKGIDFFQYMIKRRLNSE